MMRLFIAIELSDSVRQAIAALSKDLNARLEKKSRALRWVSPDLYHLTLQFLGECSEEKKTALAQALLTESRSLSPFQLAFDGLHHFSDGKRFKVLWLGVGEGKSAIENAAQAVQEGMRPLGFLPGRSFHAHVTLARSHGMPKTWEIMDRFKDYTVPPIGPMPVTHLTLFQSVLTAKGPQYTPIYAASLKSSSYLERSYPRPNSGT